MNSILDFLGWSIGTNYWSIQYLAYEFWVSADTVERQYDFYRNRQNSPKRFKLKHQKNERHFLNKMVKSEMNKNIQGPRKNLAQI